MTNKLLCLDWIYCISDYISWLIYVKTANCSETSIAIYQLSRCHFSEKAIIYLQPYHNVKSRTILYKRVIWGVTLTTKPILARRLKKE